MRCRIACVRPKAETRRSLPTQPSPSLENILQRTEPNLKNHMVDRNVITWIASLISINSHPRNKCGPNLYVILDHFVAEEQHVPSTGDRRAEFGHAAYRQFRLCLC